MLKNYRGRLATAALVLLAGWEISALVNARRLAPAPEDWTAAAAAVRASAGKDALIIFAPDWIDPVGRLWLGDRISLDQAARMDAARYREIWEVSIRHASAPEVAGETAVSVQTFGRVRVRQFVKPAVAVTWDLSKEAHVHEVDFQPRKGVLLELRHALHQQRAVYRGISLGTELHVSAGLANYGTRHENRAVAMLQVMVDGQEVSRGYIGNDSGWVALPVAPTPPGIHDVELIARVQDPRGPVRLALCVAAESRMPPQ